MGIAFSLCAGWVVSLIERAGARFTRGGKQITSNTSVCFACEHQQVDYVYVKIFEPRGGV